MFEEFKRAFEEAAGRRGFEAWELQAISTKRLRVSLKVGEAPSILRSDVMGVALRAEKDGRTGYSFAERLDRDGAEFLAMAAEDGLSVSQQGSACGVYPPGSEYPEVKNYDPRLGELDFAIDLAERVNRYVVSLDASTAPTQLTHVTVDEKQVFVANSSGLNLSHKYNYATVELHPTVSDGTKRRESAVFASMNMSGGPDIEALCEEGVETARAYLSAQVPDSGKYPVVFRNSIATHLIAGFAIFFCGEQVRRRISLVGDKIGQKVASEALTVIDDPLLPKGIFSCPFDAQGVPARTKTVVERGVLRTILHNLNTAFAVGTKSTGNGYRMSHDQPLEAAPSNIFIAPGEYTEEDLFEMMGDGIYVTRLVSTFHGAGVNAISGDFSMPARGFRIRNGKKCEALELFTVSGNYYELIRNIKACANNVIFGQPYMLIPGAPAEYGNYGAPAVLVDGISVAGR